MLKVTLAQLPIPQPAALSPTGNVPLAAGALAVAALTHGLGERVSIEVLPAALTDRYGDTRLAEAIARDAPDLLCLSLYLWNVERSLHLARAVQQRSPRTRVIIGGPEVSPDNPFVLQQDGFDLAVTGEAEATFAALLQALLDQRDPAAVPGIAVRRDGRVLPFMPPASAQFPLADYPSPYLAHQLAVEPDRSIYVETVRGCRSHCTFCFYPRSSSVLRVLDVDASLRMISALRDLGAREIVFLDPTFNHRPGFDELLDGLARLNADQHLSFFAEVRAEGLTEAHAERLARAHFTRLEIGLQSVNPEALKLTRRGGSAALVASAANMLQARGIELLVDLIVGLPGDTEHHVARGVDFLLEHGLAGAAQVFPLAVLPGTVMRATAADAGLVFDPAPPYHVRRTRTMDEATLGAALLAAEERLEHRVDEYPRPHLVAHDPSIDPPDVFSIDVSHAQDGDLSQVARAGARHVALWLEGRDLYAARHLIERVLQLRLAVDPYATLDVVLRPRFTFPLDLLYRVRKLLAAGTPSYASRVLAHRGEDQQRRIAVVLREGVRLADDLAAAIMTLVPVFQDQRIAVAVQNAARLGDDLPGARIIGAPPEVEPAWRELAQRADPECVTFADRALESRWIRNVLGHREVPQ
ncbi:MAG: radical SAM protein [Planctomycetota bacterium]